MDSRMQWGSCSAAAAWGVIEQAKEELEILEMQHPDHFHTLKLELRAFITDLHHDHSHNNATISAATQESSSSRKLKRNMSDGGGGGMMKRRRRV
ncbi:hypothetical protein Sango_0652700 [Sesamum angolense]|uniref:Uncharacterized protein n=1 Tax=Sesamum angolense TaxID=2727404 RepID=A0AAE1X6Y1_9LAMI|nr:hypothetical protein Sango_0652700 [Sesamum angolense]